MKISKGLPLSFLLIFILTSCRNNIEKEIMGVWVIDKILFDNQDIKINLLANAMTFRKDFSCDIPIVNVEDNHTDKQKGEWQVDKKGGQTFLTIKTSNELFNRTFKVDKIWKEHDNKSHGELLKVILISENMLLQCARDASDIPF